MISPHIKFILPLKKEIVKHLAVVDIPSHQIYTAIKTEMVKHLGAIHKHLGAIHKHLRAIHKHLAVGDISFISNLYCH